MTSVRYGKYAFAPMNTRPARGWLLVVCLLVHGVSAAFEIEMGNVTITDTFVSPTWTSVSFAQAFPTVPVVVSLATNQGGDPANVRIRNVLQDRQTR